jgi:hypothetical protein
MLAAGLWPSTIAACLRFRGAAAEARVVPVQGGKDPEILRASSCLLGANDVTQVCHIELEPSNDDAMRAHQ